MSTIAAPHRRHHRVALTGGHTLMGAGRGTAAPRRAAQLSRALAVLLALVVLGWTLATGLSSTSLADVPAQAPLSVVVQSGDTVWDLAVRYAPQGVSTQEYMMAIVTHNEVRATALQPGSVLQLPR